MFPNQTAGRIALGMVLLTVALSVSPALAYGGLITAVLRVHEVPARFTSTNTRVYTSYVPFLKVKVQGPFGKAEDACGPPSIFTGKYHQAMIQSFGSTSRRPANMRVCSFLYDSATRAHKAYGELVRSATSNAHTFTSHKSASKVGNESTAYAGTESEEVVFRSDNVAIQLWYTDVSGVAMSLPAFLHLGAVLVGRLR